MEIGSPRLDPLVATLKLKCSACSSRLVLEDVMGPGGAIVIGAGIEALGRKMLRQPYACPKCRLNFCAQCTMTKAKEKNIDGYVCLRCGEVIVEGDARARVLIPTKRERESKKWWQLWK